MPTILTSDLLTVNDHDILTGNRTVDVCWCVVQTPALLSGWRGQASATGLGAAVDSLVSSRSIFVGKRRSLPSTLLHGRGQYLHVQNKHWRNSKRTDFEQNDDSKPPKSSLHKTGRRQRLQTTDLGYKNKTRGTATFSNSNSTVASQNMIMPQLVCTIPYDWDCTV